VRSGTRQQLTRDGSRKGLEVLYLELLDALSARDPDEVRHAHKGEAPCVAPREGSSVERGCRTARLTTVYRRTAMARGTMRVTLTGSDEESQPGCSVTPSVLALRKL